MKFGVSERFFEGTTYYENEFYDLNKEKLAQFAKSGQIKRLIPMDPEAAAAVEEAMGKTAPVAGVDPVPADGEGNEPALEDMTKAQLLELAETMGVEISASMNKAEIIAAINAAKEQ